jgi:pimeloyl-ACP methyl ester carboxylesterase
MPGNSFEETEFQVHSLTLKAKRWNKGAPVRAIAMHGWLDNCGSFDPMADLLDDIDLIALDSAGQGYSDFRSPDGQYLIWAEVGEIFAVADQLGWETFNLVGHSRGAGIAAISAGTFPDRIEKLVLIEGGVPLPMEAKDVPENLANHILDNQRLSGTRGSVFGSRQKAIEARADGFTKIRLATAEILAKRSLVEDEKGYRWHADPRLKAPSGLKLTHDQIDAFLGRISAPTLLIEGTQGLWQTMPFRPHHIARINKLEEIVLEGGHHLHMEESVSECANAITHFLAN